MKVGMYFSVLKCCVRSMYLFHTPASSCVSSTVLMPMVTHFERNVFVCVNLLKNDGHDCLTRSKEAFKFVLCACLHFDCRNNVPQDG